ncbi:hypothetical protein [Streptomyces apricus]|uniref:Uncharacterized protein n=1 Tax=Streptomyces apricus TaxID=1828112 RepID=A0A5B0A567_9ACTN|nr:hypothetical protein [Streptomyces apricus]KAA0924262.1 hypothetical protein FGF04_33110 [Streptomyces apricus]
MSTEDQYAAEEAVIERELTEAQFLEFDDYVGFLAHYGARIWELARRHDHPEIAHRHLMKYSDDFLESFNEE